MERYNDDLENRFDEVNKKAIKFEEEIEVSRQFLIQHLGLKWRSEASKDLEFSLDMLVKHDTDIVEDLEEANSEIKDLKNIIDSLEDERDHLQTRLSVE